MINFSTIAPRDLALKLVERNKEAVNFFNHLKLNAPYSDDPFSQMVVAESEFYTNSHLARLYASSALNFEQVKTTSGFEVKQFYSIYCSQVFSSLSAEQISAQWEKRYCELINSILKIDNVVELVNTIQLKSHLNFSSKKKSEDKYVKAIEKLPQRTALIAYIIDMVEKYKLTLSSSSAQLGDALSHYNLEYTDHTLASLIVCAIYPNNYYLKDIKRLDKIKTSILKDSTFILEHDYFILDHLLSSCLIDEKEFWTMSKKVMPKDFIEFLETHPYLKSLGEKKLLETSIAISANEIKANKKL